MQASIFFSCNCNIWIYTMPICLEPLHNSYIHLLCMLYIFFLKSYLVFLQSLKLQPVILYLTLCNFYLRNMQFHVQSHFFWFCHLNETFKWIKDKWVGLDIIKWYAHNLAFWYGKNWEGNFQWYVTYFSVCFSMPSQITIRGWLSVAPRIF